MPLARALGSVHYCFIGQAARCDLFHIIMPPPRAGALSNDVFSDVCLSISVAYILNIHGAHSYWKQGALGSAGVRRVWAGAGSHRAQGRGHIARFPAQLVKFPLFERLCVSF